MDGVTTGMDFLSTAIHRLRYYKELGDTTLARLSQEELHYQPNEESNSIAIIVQHMHGNMLSRWTNFLTEDGEKDWRQRDDEFEAHSYTKEKVMELWEQGWKCFLETISTLTDEDLTRTVLIRQECLTVVDAINRQLAHHPYHVGQIVYIGKMLKNKEWKSLSIPKGKSREFNSSDSIKDPAKKFKS